MYLQSGGGAAYGAGDVPGYPGSGAAGIGGYPSAGGNSLFSGGPFGGGATAGFGAGGFGAGGFPSAAAGAARGAQAYPGQAGSVGHLPGGMVGYNMNLGGMGQMPGAAGMGMFGGAGLPQMGTSPSANAYYNSVARPGAYGTGQQDPMAAYGGYKPQGAGVAGVGGYGASVGFPGASVGVGAYGASQGFGAPAAGPGAGFGGGGAKGGGGKSRDAYGGAAGGSKGGKGGKDGCGSKGGGGKGSDGSQGKGKGGGSYSQGGFDGGFGGKGAGYGGGGKGGGGGGGAQYGKGSYGKAAESTPNHSNLFVGNLVEGTSEQKVRDAFSSFGRVLSARVFTRNGRTCSLVKMSSVQEADQACRTAPAHPAMGDSKTRWLVKFADSDAGSGGKGDGMGGGKGKMGDKGGYGGYTGGGKGYGGFSFGEQKPRREREQKDVSPSENLYVKGLPPRVTDGQLHNTFSKVGKVVELKILRYSDSLECAALVRMDAVESASAAIEKLNGTTPEGAVPPLSVSFHGKDPASTSDNLYVKGLPLNLNQDHLHLLFGQCGTVKRSRVLPASPNYEALDSAALVQMGNGDEAAKAIQMLNGRVPDMVGPQMVIRFAEPKSTTENKPQPSDNLYVKGLPLGTPDFLLRAVFVQFGTVVRLKILEPRGNEAMDCAALVQMASVEEAQASVESLHGRVLAAPLPPMRVRFAGKDQEESANLYVAGLPTTIMEQQLRQTFAECGNVVRLRLLVDGGKPETHALVQMGSVEEAQVAIDKLHNEPPESTGPTLIVRFAADRPKKEGDEDGEEDDEEDDEQSGDEKEQDDESPARAESKDDEGVEAETAPVAPDPADVPVPTES